MKSSYLCRPHTINLHQPAAAHEKTATFPKRPRLSSLSPSVPFSLHYRFTCRLITLADYSALRVLLVIGFLFSAFTASLAQGFNSKPEPERAGNNTTVYKTYYKTGKNLPGYDEKRIHYGFYVGTNVSTFVPEASNFFMNRLYDSARAGDSTVLIGMEPAPGLGFTTGFIFNLRLDEFWDIRFLPSVSFYSRYIEFKQRNNFRSNQLNRFTFSFIELPILMKFKSQRRGNSRAYLLAGIKPSFEVGSRRDEQGFDELRANSSDFSIDVGGGFDFYYPYFKFSPEIRFSYGIADMKFPDDNRFARSVRRMNTYTVSFLFNFE